MKQSWKRTSGLLFILFGISCYAQHDHHDHEGCSGHGVQPDRFELKEATGGRIERKTVFPAEIRMNRDRYAAVSPGYPSLVRELLANPGETVQQGAVLAILENRETLAVYPVLSPLTGTVISKNSSVGESAGEGTVLFEIADLSSVWADIHIFPQYQSAVRKGSPVELIAPGGQTMEAVVGYMSPLASPETRTFTARCVLSCTEGGFSPGLLVRARITVESVQAEVRVEQEAVQFINGEAVVFVQDEDGVEPRDVQTGLSDGEFVEIKAGLKPGERYVVHGAFELKAELITRGLDPHAGHGH